MDSVVDLAATASVQELWTSLALGVGKLAGETNDVMFEKESFREFSSQIVHLSIVFEALHDKRVAPTSLESTRASLQALESQLNKACNFIKDYKSGSKLRFLLESKHVLKQMQEIGKEIARTISLLELGNTDTTLYLKSEMDAVISNLTSTELSSTTSTEAIASDIDKLMAGHVRNHDHALRMLHKIAEASGASMNASLVQDELALLKQEKEEMEAQKKQAEALQLSQLIQLLCSSDMLPCPTDEESTYHQNLMDSFTCPLCQELMTDPVAIACGHSFERKAIEEQFRQGAISCPICKQDLSSAEITPNLSLRGSIEEWKQRDMDTKFQTAVSGITSADHDIVSKSLENLQDLMKIPRYRAVVSEKGLTSKLVELLQHSNTNTSVVIKCLYHLSCHSEENKVTTFTRICWSQAISHYHFLNYTFKYLMSHVIWEKFQEIMINEGSLHHIVNCLFKEEADTDAVAILQELSTKEAHAERIGNAEDCIPLLVSMLHSNKDDATQSAKKVLENLSSNTHFVIKMAQAGYFNPFVFRFNEGTLETRTSMAAALVTIQIEENNTESFKDKQFIHKLVEMLSSSSPACKKASLQCIKKLLLNPEMVERFLEDTTTISNLVGLIAFDSAEMHWKLETAEVIKTAEVITTLIENSQTFDCQRYPDLQKLQSQHNVSVFISLMTTSEPQTKVKFLQLLIALGHKSEIARDLVRSNNDAVDDLFSSLNSDHLQLREQAMKLMYSVSVNHPAGVPLPTASRKKYAINALVTIFSSSPDNKERSTAAAIISHLPADDINVDEILYGSEVLRVIREVLCTMDNENCTVKILDNQDKSLLENSLAALLRYTQPNKPDLQRQLRERELYPSLVRVLSEGSLLAKEYAATALANLSQSNNTSINGTNIISEQPNNSVPPLQQHGFLHKIFCCFSATTTKMRTCSIHGSFCSSRCTFCFVEADAVRPLIQILSNTESGAAEAALKALNTMLNDSRTLSQAADVIVHNQGVAAILEVLEKGTPTAKEEALDLFHKIVEHTEIAHKQSQRAERILIHLLADDTLKKRTALVLKQMNILPEQSSYF